MTKKFSRFTGWALALPLLVSCNVWKPFTSNSSDEDHREEAKKCLHDKDFACAVENYNLLSDPTEKNKELCAVQISQAGITLDVLATQLAGKFSATSVLGDLAIAVAPYTTEKITAATQAITTCNNFRAMAGATDTSTLLTTAAYLVDISLRIARTAVAVGNSNTDTDCTTAPPSPGNVVKGNICGSSGTLSASNPGMCQADATAVISDFIAISPLLNNTQLNGLLSLYNSVTSTHPEFKNLGQENAARTTLKSYLPN